MKKFSLWSLFFDSERVTKLQDEVAELKEVVANQKQVNFAYFKQKHLLIKENLQLEKELEHTKEQLRVQTEMYKNSIKDGHKWQGEN